jgi:hypothetical protein
VQGQDCQRGDKSRNQGSHRASLYLRNHVGFLSRFADERENKPDAPRDAANFQVGKLCAAWFILWSYCEEKASKTLPGMPLPVPMYPEPTKSIPFTTTGPGAPSEPPFPFTPLTVTYG